AAATEAWIEPHLQQLACVGPETHRLTREQAVDARAPLLSHAPGLNARGSCADPGAFEHGDRRPPPCQVICDRKADDAGADDHDVRPRTHTASLDSQLVFDYADRQRRLAERMDADSVEVIFLAPSADLEYLTGIARQIPNFGEASYASGWVAGAFFVPGSDPVFVFPRMFAAFDLREEPQGELVVVSE